MVLQVEMIVRPTMHLDLVDGRDAQIRLQINVLACDMQVEGSSIRELSQSPDG